MNSDYRTRPWLAPPGPDIINQLDRLRHFNDELVKWVHKKPAQSTTLGITLCCAGAGLLLVAPPVIAAGAGMVSFGCGLAALGGGIGCAGVVLGVLGRSPDAMRGGLWIGSAAILGGGATAGAGLALQAVGVVVATGGGALVAGGIGLAVVGGVHLVRRRPERMLRHVQIGVEGQLRESNHDPSAASTMLLDLGDVQGRR